MAKRVVLSILSAMIPSIMGGDYICATNLNNNFKKVIDGTKKIVENHPIAIKSIIATTIVGTTTLSTGLLLTSLINSNNDIVTSILSKDEILFVKNFKKDNIQLFDIYNNCKDIITNLYNNFNNKNIQFEDIIENLNKLQQDSFFNKFIKSGDIDKLKQLQKDNKFNELTKYIGDVIIKCVVSLYAFATISFEADKISKQKECLKVANDVFDIYSQNNISLTKKDIKSKEIICNTLIDLEKLTLPKNNNNNKINEDFSKKIEPTKPKNEKAINDYQTCFNQFYKLKKDLNNMIKTENGMNSSTVIYNIPDLFNIKCVYNLAVIPTLDDVRLLNCDILDKIYNYNLNEFWDKYKSDILLGRTIESKIFLNDPEINLNDVIDKLPVQADKNYPKYKLLLNESNILNSVLISIGDKLDNNFFKTDFYIKWHDFYSFLTKRYVSISNIDEYLNKLDTFKSYFEKDENIKIFEENIDKLIDLSSLDIFYDNLSYEDKINNEYSYKNLKLSLQMIINNIKTNIKDIKNDCIKLLNDLLNEQVSENECVFLHEMQSENTNIDIIKNFHNSFMGDLLFDIQKELISLLTSESIDSVFESFDNHMIYIDKKTGKIFADKNASVYTSNDSVSKSLNNLMYMFVNTCFDTRNNLNLSVNSKVSLFNNKIYINIPYIIKIDDNRLVSNFKAIKSSQESVAILDKIDKLCNAIVKISNFLGIKTAFYTQEEIKNKINISDK